VVRRVLGVDAFVATSALIKIAIIVALASLAGSLGLSLESRLSTSNTLTGFRDQMGHACAPGKMCLAPAETPLNVLFVGDIMFDRQVADWAKGDWSHPFEKVGPVKDGVFGRVDVAVANLEGPVTTKRAPPDKTIDFAFDPKVVPALKTEGFDAVSQANNHTLDQGRIGADVSRTLLSAGGLAVFGDQARDEATSSLAIVRSGQTKLALLGFHTVDRSLDLGKAAEAILRAKQEADVVIVFMHWGVEYTEKPSASEIALAHWFVDHGVDAVMGSHPHWMQSVEVYSGRPIVYSLGNFVFDQDWSHETREGLAVRFDIGGTRRLELFPIELTRSQPTVLSGAARDERLARLASISDPSLMQQILAGTLELPAQE